MGPRRSTPSSDGAGQNRLDWIGLMRIDRQEAVLNVVLIFCLIFFSFSWDFLGIFFIWGFFVVVVVVLFRKGKANRARCNESMQGTMAPLFHSGTASILRERETALRRFRFGQRIGRKYIKARAD